MRASSREKKKNRKPRSLKTVGLIETSVRLSHLRDELWICAVPAEIVVVGVSLLANNKGISYLISGLK